jgi:hypothetical protein
VIGELVVDDRLSSIAVELNHAYLTGSVGGPLGGVRVVDISDPHNPTQVGEYIESNPFPPRVLDAAGDLVFVVQYGDLSILDVSDPAAPALAGRWEPPSGSIRAGSVDGQVAYLATYESGGPNHIHAVDVSDPAHPMALGSLSFDEDPRAVASVGHLVYLTTDPELIVIDASDPSVLAVVGSYSAASATLGLLAVAGTTAYVADSSHAYTVGSDGLHVVDVSDPALPIPVGSFEAAWSSFSTRVAVADGLAVVAAELEALHVIDVAEPHSPAEVAVFEEMHFSPTDVAFERGRVLVSNGGPGILRIIDVTAPHAPFQVAASGLNLEGEGVSVSGNLAYVAAGSGGVAIFDISGCDAIVFRDDFESGNTSRWPVVVP